MNHRQQLAQTLNEALENILDQKSSDTAAESAPENELMKEYDCLREKCDKLIGKIKKRREKK